MNIEKLKKAAVEFMRYKTISGHIYSQNSIGDAIYVDNFGLIPLEEWDPQKETGRHFLVEMENNMSSADFELYQIEMSKVWYKTGVAWSFERWFKTAPAELCFEKIMEVVGGNK